MTTREALNELASRGIHLTYWELRGMLERGEIPRPRMNSALSWDWTEADIRAVATAAANRQAQEAK
jgi:hypothetical protein